MRVLSIDCGGTNTRVAAFDATTSKIELQAQARYSNSEYQSLAEILNRYVRDECLSECLAGVAVAVAGDVRDGAATVCNAQGTLRSFSWARVEGRELARLLGTPRILMMNDVEAMITHIAGPSSSGDFLNIQSEFDIATTAPIALVVPGTGFGQAFSVGSPQRRSFVSSEAAHVYWPATSELGRGLDHFLHKSSGRETRLEDVISGPGIVNIFNFFCNRRGIPQTSRSGIGVAQLVQKGTDGALPFEYVSAAQDTLTFFFTELARECAQAAIRTNAKGGVIMAGAVISAHLDRIRDSSFARQFASCDWGDDFLASIPLAVSRALSPAQLGVAQEWKKEFC